VIQNHCKKIHSHRILHLIESHLPPQNKNFIPPDHDQEVILESLLQEKYREGESQTLQGEKEKTDLHHHTPREGDHFLGVGHGHHPEKLHLHAGDIKADHDLEVQGEFIDEVEVRHQGEVEADLFLPGPIPQDLADVVDLCPGHLVDGAGLYRGLGLHYHDREEDV
jgi:hypothetical protein